MIQKLAGFFFLLGLLSTASAAKLDSLSMTPSSDGLVINCLITGNSSYHVFVLHQPERLIIDLPATQTSLNIKQIHLLPNRVLSARMGHPDPKTLRVVLDLAKSIGANKILVTPTRISQKIHLKIRLISSHVISSAPSAAQVTKTISAINTTSRVSPPILPHALRDVVVVIDPGHGGHDPGAIGMRRTHEKQVVLAIALKLKHLIDQQPGMHAVLTRKGDYYIGLRDRMHIARQYNGDIFVAIHADAFGNPASHGASVFALSQRGATSEAARWLAEKENYSELGGVNLSELDDRNGVIRSVLIDLSQTATISASLQIGGQVLHHLNQITTLHSHKVEQARFMVLKSPDIPSVLIETGFISNPNEEAKLTNPSYQTRLCQAMMQGIKAYFWDYPPHGSRIEALSGANHHLISRRSEFLRKSSTS